MILKGRPEDSVTWVKELPGEIHSLCRKLGRKCGQLDTLKESEYSWDVEI